MLKLLETKKPTEIVAAEVGGAGNSVTIGDARAVEVVEMVDNETSDAVVTLSCIDGLSDEPELTAEATDVKDEGATDNVNCGTDAILDGSSSID
jgi:hypothetical protein